MTVRYGKGTKIEVLTTMKYITEQIRIRRQNRQIDVREMAPEGSAVHDWRKLKAEAQAEQEGGDDGR